MSDTAAAETTPKKKGKKKLIVTALGVVVLLGGGVGAGLYAGKLFGGRAQAAEAPGPKLVPKSEQKQAAPPEGGEEQPKHGGGQATPAGAGGDRYASNYYSLDKEFTSNLRDSVHFVQVGIAVSTPYDDTVIEHLKTNEIAVRSAILMALSDTTEEQVFTGDGKAQLQKRLTAAINATLKQKEGFGGVSNTYFTSFVVQ